MQSNNQCSIPFLTSQEAERLLKINGLNVLKEEKPKSIFQMFLEQILNFTNAILGVAIIISIVLNDYWEAAIMIFIVIANAIIGVVQENKAAKALEALKKMSVIKATVIRDGRKQEISAENLVVGDQVIVEAGQQVPADLDLKFTANLQIDEKALTGESVAVNKDANYISSDTDGIGDKLNKAYMSTIVTYGRGIGIVEHTGMQTEIGKIADMVSKEKAKPSPLQKGMDELSKTLGIAIIIICIIVFFVGVLQGRNILEMLMTAVSLAVAAIPEGIPTIVTIVMALGMQRMAKVNAIVKTMPAGETLGAVGIVCSDKTGTLTQNKMTVMKAYVTGQQFEANEIKPNSLQNDFLIKGMMLCTDAVITDDGKEIGDPTETALVSYAKTFKMDKAVFEKLYPRINEKSFDSDRKLMTTVHRIENDVISFTKGSTDELITRCTKIMENSVIRDITDADIAQISKIMSEWSNSALRVLSLAIKYDNPDAIEQDLCYVGMVGMIDPERPEVITSIKTFNQAGIKTVMITGDHRDTALAIAKNLGLASTPDECIMGHELDKLSDEELANRVGTLRIFARVSPEHKVRIVKAFQANGYIVSMTGDGVNDSPSLKAANVGVAMGITGTDVAKGAADIILQDDKFTTIEKAIKEGRNIFENIKKSIVFALSSNISEIITMFVAIIAGLSAPLNAVNILWVNLLTDSLPCFALGVDPNSASDVMNKKPRKVNESIFSDGGFLRIGVYGVAIAVCTLIAFICTPLSYLITIGQNVSLNAIANCMQSQNDILAISQTLAFSTLAFSELFHAIGMRDVNTSIIKFNHFDNKVMIGAFLFGIATQIIVVELPICNKIFGTVSLGQSWLFVILLSLVPLLIHEIMVLFQLLEKKCAKNNTFSNN